MDVEWVAFLRAFVGVFLLIAVAMRTLGRASTIPFLMALGISARMAALASRGLSILEGLLAFLLLIGILVPLAALAASALTIAFVCAHLIANRRNVLEDCNCFGPLDVPQSARLSLIRSLLLAGAATGLAVLCLRNDPMEVMANRAKALPLEVWGMLSGLGWVGSFAVIGQVLWFRARTDQSAAGTNQRWSGTNGSQGASVMTRR